MPRSPGRTRRSHGNQAGATSASAPGSNTTSFTVGAVSGPPLDSVTDQRQPRYPPWVAAK